MSFSFVHPEFFIWMLPGIFVLFYFWLTQKTPEQRWLSVSALQRLRSGGEATMGLRERNLLFLVASVFLISAMAQPVLIDPDPLAMPGAKVVMAIEAGGRFESTKTLALKMLEALEGKSVAVVAYDSRVYRISPQSVQHAMTASLIDRLDAKGFERTSDRSGMLRALDAAGTLERCDALLILSAASGSQTLRERPQWIGVISSAQDIPDALSRIERQEKERSRRFHIPLFYYPLGCAMLLILIALSSKSRRRSVPLALSVLLLVGYDVPATAGIVDFRLLDEATECYERGEYERSARLFAAYQERHDSAQVRYNRANALFRSGRYEQALFWYAQVHTVEPELARRARYNLEITRQRIGTEVPVQRRAGTEKEMQRRRGEERKPLSATGTRLFAFP